MPTIVLTRSVQANGEPHAAGDVVTVEESSAAYLVRAGSARPATDNEIRAARNPQPASEIRQRLTAQAIPDGLRPHRHG